MYVSNMMVTDLITATPEQTIAEVLDLMAEHDIHRIPIVQGQKLVGLVSETVVSQNSPSQASSYSVHELNYLLAKTKIADIMLKKVITIKPSALIEQAAEKMVKHDIGCLPVVDENYNLVGLITNNTILTAFTELMGLYEPGSRIVVAVPEDKPGVLAALSTIFAQANINLTHLAVHRSHNLIEVVIRCNETNKEYVSELLTSQGYQVTSII